MIRRLMSIPVLVLVAGCHHGARPRPAAEQFTMTTDGGWSWFQDERAIVDDNLLVVGAVATGHEQADRRGNVEVHWRNLVTGESGTSILHERLEADDHDAPGLLVLDDGRILAVYTRHGRDSLIRMRRSMLPGMASVWTAETRVDAGPGATAGVTYSNVYRIDQSDGTDRIYNFYRGEDWDPNAIVSENTGSTWQPAGRLMTGPGRPYVRYAADNSKIHFMASEQHPRDADNSIWHGYLQDGKLYRSGGEVVGFLGSDPPRVEDYTPVFEGRPDAVAWPADLVLDRNGSPVGVYTVQVDGASRTRGTGGRDHRFRYARWIGDRWLDFEAGYAGRKLYAGEDDYTGLAVVDPVDPRVIYVSTDAHPRTGDPVVTESDGVRRRELFQGMTYDGGRTWQWTPLTSESQADNIRPVAVAWGDDRTVLLWLHGTMRSYTDYDLEIRGRILDRRPDPDQESR
ncbi:MAG: BNR repeat-containing protein [Phycisphaerales bacterium]|nr:BNR repeat-containing protein [Phycisphaerales bacterium]